MVLEALEVESLDKAIQKVESSYVNPKLLADLCELRQMIEDGKAKDKKLFSKMYVDIVTKKVDAEKKQTEAREKMQILVFMRAGASQTGLHPLTIIRRLARTLLHMADIKGLENIQEEIEAYFNVQQNISNIKLIAQSNK